MITFFNEVMEISKAVKTRSQSSQETDYFQFSQETDYSQKSARVNPSSRI